LTANPFDDKAATWDEDPMKVERARCVARSIAHQVPLEAKMRVVDFGAGTGLLGFALLPNVMHCTFVDPSSAMRAQVDHKLAQGHADRGRAVSPDQLEPGERFNLLVSLMTLHHIPNVEAGLAQMVDLLDSTGWIALCDLDLEDGSFHGPEDDSVHRGFDRSELVERLRNHGLRNIVSSTPYAIERGGDEESLSYPLFLITGQRSGS
jgi:predicted TPR repeat methyltransferase